ncbi:MAG: methyltransferase domain-containing protein [Novosphingobium sp.]|nr:methyltransferase domain-containing protein [Novosphingobium sp.]
MELMRKLLNQATGGVERVFGREGRRAIIANHPTHKERGGLNINIGSGRWSHPNWIALDVPSDHYHGKDRGSFIPYNLLENDLPFEDATVDLAYCSAVIEHVPDSADEKLFSEIARVLKPGGLARIVAPDAEFLYRGTVHGPANFWASRHPWTQRSTHSTNPEISEWAQEDFLIRELATARCRFYRHQTAPLQPESIWGLSFEDTLAVIYEGIEYRIEHLGDHVNWWTHTKVANFASCNGLTTHRSGAGQCLNASMRDMRYFDRSQTWLNLHIDLVKV